MKLFLLELIPEGPPGYDCTCSVIVRALNEKQARALANEELSGGDEFLECPDCWLDPLFTSCKKVSEIGKAEVLLRSPSTMQ